MDQKLLNDARMQLERTNRRIHMVIPSILASGESFSLKMTAFGPDQLLAPLDREIELKPTVTAMRPLAGRAAISGLWAPWPHPNP